MPILHLYAPTELPPEGMIDDLCRGVAHSLSIDEYLPWAFWHYMPPGTYRHPKWRGAPPVAPAIIMYCRTIYPKDAVEAAILDICRRITDHLACDKNDIFVAVQRVHAGELFVSGHIWKEA